MFILLFASTSIYASDMNSSANTSDSSYANISKNTGNSSKLEANTVLNAKNYSELSSRLNYVKNQTSGNYTIRLNGNSYNSTGVLLLGNTRGVKSLVIEGNGKTINASKLQFMRVSNGYSLTVKNLSIVNAHCNVGNGSVFNNNGNLTVINCTFRYNNVSSGYGGAIYSTGSLFINNSRFIINKATNGGAIYMTGSNNRILHTFFNSNLAFSRGGVIFVQSGRNNTINWNDFTYNNAYSGGGLFLNASSNNFINYNNFTYNYANTTASAIRLVSSNNNSIINNIMRYNTGFYNGSVELYNSKYNLINNNLFNYNVNQEKGSVLFIGDFSNYNTFSNNICLNNSAKCGGAIYLQASSNNITDNTFSYNKANTYGGAIFVKSNINYNKINGNSFVSNNANYGGAIQVNSSSYTEIFNNTFNQNHAHYGGVLYLNSNVSIINNSFMNNYVDTNSSYVIYTNASSTIKYNVFDNNTNNKRDMLLGARVSNVISSNSYVNNYLNDSWNIKTTGNLINITFSLRSVYNDTIRNGTLTVTVNNKTYMVKNVVNGSVGRIYIANDSKNIVKLGINNVTLRYTSLSKHYQNLRTNLTVNVTSMIIPTIVSVESVSKPLLTNVTLRANVTDFEGKIIKSGKLIFRVNGKTLRTDGIFGSNKTTLTLNVTNGKVSYTIFADRYIKGNQIITAKFLGSGVYNESTSDDTQFNILQRSVGVNITTVSVTRTNKNITFSVKLKDRYTGGSVLNNSKSFVMFKINGLTLKDKNGNTVKVSIINSTAKYTYFVEPGTAGILSNNSAYPYVLTVIYYSPDYVITRNTTNYRVEPSPTNITITKVVISGRHIAISASLTDYNHMKTRGVSSIAIKINGVTVAQNKATNGSVYANLYIGGTNPFTTVTVVSGPRYAYLKNQTTLTVNNKNYIK